MDLCGDRIGCVEEVGVRAAWYAGNRCAGECENLPATGHGRAWRRHRCTSIRSDVERFVPPQGQTYSALHGHAGRDRGIQRQHLIFRKFGKPSECAGEGPDALPAGKHTLEYDFRYDGLGFATLAFNNLSGLGLGGTGTFKVDGKVSFDPDRCAAG